jgi:hypothetical protein
MTKSHILRALKLVASEPVPAAALTLSGTMLAKVLPFRLWERQM